MRILVGADAPPDPNSGAAGTVFATTAALRDLGHTVDEIWANDLAHRIRHWNLHYLLELPREYRSAVAKRRRTSGYDVVQLSQPHAWLAAKDHLQQGWAGIFVNRSHGLESLADAALSRWHRELGVPESVFPRSLATSFVRARLHRHIDLAVAYSDGWVVPASDIRDHLVQYHGASPARVAVVPHGIPDEYLTRALTKMTRERLQRMLYVGQFSFIKGPRFLAEAVSRILIRNDKASMTWVCGKAHHEKVRDLLYPEVRGRVRLLDWMSQSELLALYDEHGIHLAHSLYEGAAKACTEAMARGQVVVSSAVGALRDHIVSGTNGWLVDVGDVDGMVRAALDMLGEHGAAADIGARAAETTAGLSWRECASKSIEFYKLLMQQRTEGRQWA